jgi:hypothetical protein
MSKSLWLALALLSVGCKEVPASIKVKLPRDSVQAKKESPPPMLRKKGERLELRASAFNARDTYMGPAKATWSSSDPKVISIDDAGVAEVTGSGESVITATSGELTASITLKARIVDAVKIVPPAGWKDRLKMGQEVKFTADVRDDRGQPVTDARVFWKNPDNGCFVSDDGTVKGAAIGEAVLVAEAEGKTGQLSFQVLDR